MDLARARLVFDVSRYRYSTYTRMVVFRVDVPLCDWDGLLLWTPEVRYGEDSSLVSSS